MVPHRLVIVCNKIDPNSGAVRLERLPMKEQLVGHHSKRPEVGMDRVAMGWCENLRGDIRKGAACTVTDREILFLSISDESDAEIDEDRSTAAVKNNILWLDITMNDVMLVKELESRADTSDNISYCTLREGLTNTKMISEITRGKGSHSKVADRVLMCCIEKLDNKLMLN
jgi:hypothetical protein